MDIDDCVTDFKKYSALFIEENENEKDFSFSNTIDKLNCICKL